MRGSSSFRLKNRATNVTRWFEQDRRSDPGSDASRYQRPVDRDDPNINFQGSGTPVHFVAYFYARNVQDSTDLFDLETPSDRSIFPLDFLQFLLAKIRIPTVSKFDKRTK